MRERNNMLSILEPLARCAALLAVCAALGACTPGGENGEEAPGAKSPAQPTGEPGVENAGAEKSPVDAPPVAPGVEADVEPGAEPGAPGIVVGERRLEVDREAREVHIPAFFVSATQRLEVFACHETGPTHETVVAFKVDGEQIYRALLEVGFRPPDAFWNATGPHEVRRTLGDRAIVLLRWTWKGETREVPGESVIRDSEARFPLFVRGFTFVAEKRLMGDPPVERVPPAVEVTVGDPNRQGSVSSLLFHPNDLEELTPWMPPLEVDPDALEDFEQLVEQQVPCTVVVRRIDSEADLIDAVASYVEDPSRRALLEKLRPLARAVDELKARYTARVKTIRELLEQDGDDAKRDAIAERLDREVREGRAEAARIHEAYIGLFAEQEKFRAERLAARTDLEPEIRAMSVARYEHGVAYEPRLAELRALIAEIDARGDPDEKTALERRALEHDLDRLPLERTLFWARDHLADVTRRLDHDATKNDTYLRDLLVEDRMKTLADIRAIRGQIALLATQSEELRARIAGSWEGIEEKNLERRRGAERAIELAGLERDLVETMAELRWLRNFTETGPGREGDDAAKRAELTERKKELESSIAALRKELGDGEEP